MNKKTDKAYFDRLYTEASDPWNFAGSDYEQRKYERTLTALPEAHYQEALEIGCSIGVLTALLAPRCAELTALDISEIPLKIAKRRLRAHKHVIFVRATVPTEFPQGMYNLILLSEVGYYLSKAELLATKEMIIRCLKDHGVCCLVHWRPKIMECELAGDEVHALFADTRWKTIFHEENEQFMIDMFRLA